MREIKFRAWKEHQSDCAIHNEPAYPKGECDCGGGMLYDPYLKGIFIAFKDGVVQYDGCIDYSCEPSPSSLCWLPVNHIYYLMQYTGLKDKKGKEIYEGDVYRTDNKEVGIIEFCDASDHGGYVVARPLGFAEEELEVLYWNLGEVIGNIWENPELLRENDEGGIR